MSAAGIDNNGFGDAGMLPNFMEQPYASGGGRIGVPFMEFVSTTAAAQS